MTFLLLVLHVRAFFSTFFSSCMGPFSPCGDLFATFSLFCLYSEPFLGLPLYPPIQKFQRAPMNIYIYIYAGLRTAAVHYVRGLGACSPENSNKIVLLYIFGKISAFVKCSLPKNFF